MLKTTAAIIGVAANLFVATIPAFAGQLTTGSMMIADIGRDNVELTRIHETLPTVSRLSVDYPEMNEALHNVTGTTLVSVSLNAEGKILKTSIYKSCGNKFLDTKAKNGVEFATFNPGTIAGTPVGGDYSVRVEFGNDR